ncbi:M12 family metallo-peptidase [Nocardioides sp. STR2]|uniref:M12 family metallo-peptidase n=1 Tax=Nocardioides pini TaxID=2975053 RepID=A0ABT4CCF0_9ACTN|nr:M12 family metallo-peptidase [Nocardioides pini]MCY4726640.1 M12 family metallo-peptidase [Nocardioides pini]
MPSRFRSLATGLALVVGAGALSSVAPVAAAPDDQAFTPLRGFEPSGAKVRVEPKDYAASRVDLGAVRGELPRGSASAVIDVPAPDGRLQSFRVQQTQRMESELAAGHPEIATWSGVGIDDPTASIALDVTQMGFHAFVRTPGGRSDWYVDPAYNRPGTTAHLSYRSADLPAAEARRKEGEVEAIRETVTAAAADRSTASNAPVQRHYYRLALTSDPSYAAYFGTANVLAEKVTLINRVNQIYNDDLATELRLVNETDKLNLDTDAKATGADGPCGSAPCFRLEDLGAPGPNDDIPGDLDFCSGLTLGQNRTVLGQLIGASNYDVGHITLGKNGGGVAYGGVVGGDYKGGGCTGLPAPKGDFFAIDYVAHEIGHQFAGNHTFNGDLINCGGNISEASVEPGSGSSVMAYAGICGRDDLQPHTDPYFSFRTIDEVDAYRAATYPNIEVQTVSLRGFDPATEALAIQYGAGAPVPVAAYTPAGIETAVEAASATNVSIAEWGFDEFGLDDTPVVPDATGFQVIFNESPTIQGATPADVDRLPLKVTVTSGSAEAFVGETARGGPAQNDGIVLPPTGPGQVADNSAPEVRAPDPKTIPVRTPFALTGRGADPNGDALVYLWEQTNNGDGTELASNTKDYGPLFRVFGDDAVVSTADSLKSPSPGLNIADGSPTRVFPDMTQVLAGNTNAKNGTCPDASGVPEDEQMPDELLDCYSEFLPTTDYLGSLGAGDDRVMTFRLTARDLFPNGGGVAWDDVALTVDKTAGPFLVTSQATAGTTVAGGSSVPVTWDVKGTDRLAKNVRISLSTDGGTTFGTVLAASTPNDGSQTLAMPNVDAARARIKVEAVDNYFFAVNDKDFALKATPAPDTRITSGPANESIVLERRQAFTYTSSVSPATFACTVDEEAVPCDASGLTKRFRAGTHTVTVAAVNAAGVADPTPAFVSFTVPRDESTFARKGSWNRKKDKRALFGDYITSRRKGSELVTRVPTTERIVLVIGTVKNGGKARVFLGKRKLGVVKFAGKQKFSKLRSFDLPRARKGKLRVVVTKNKPVRIEGVAVVTTKKTG